MQPNMVKNIQHEFFCLHNIHDSFWSLNFFFFHVFLGINGGRERLTTVETCKLMQYLTPSHPDYPCGPWSQKVAQAIKLVLQERKRAATEGNESQAVKRKISPKAEQDSMEWFTKATLMLRRILTLRSKQNKWRRSLHCRYLARRP